MGQYFDAVILDMREDDLPALDGFVKRLKDGWSGRYDKESGVFSFLLKNTIWSAHRESEEFQKLLREFRATEFNERYHPIEIFCRAEDDEYWTAWPHRGECRHCHGVYAEEMQKAESAIATYRRDTEMANLKYDQLRGRFVEELNARNRKFIEEWMAEANKDKSENLKTELGAA